MSFLRYNKYHKSLLHIPRRHIMQNFVLDHIEIIFLLIVIAFFACQISRLIKISRKLESEGIKKNTKKDISTADTAANINVTQTSGLTGDVPNKTRS